MCEPLGIASASSGAAARGRERGPELAQQRPSPGQERYIEQMAESLGDEIKKEEMPHGSSKEQRAAFDKILDNKTSPPIDRIKLLKLLGKIV